MDLLPIQRERIERLCAALESGEYPQARGTLKTDGGNCCLGVACQLMDPTRWHKVKRDHDDYEAAIWMFLDPGITVNVIDDVGCLRDGVDELPDAVKLLVHDDEYSHRCGAESYLPDDVVAWYGFEDSNPAVSVPCLCTQNHEDELGKFEPDPDCGTCDGGHLERVTTILSELNDEWRIDFKQIAAAIRRTYLDDEVTA